MTIRRTLQTQVLLPSLLLSMAGGLHAQDDFFFDDEEEEAPAVTHHDTNIEFGFGYLDGGSRHLGRNNGLGDRNFEPLLSIQARSRPDERGDSARFWRIEAQRVTWDSRRVLIEAGEQGRQTFGFSWRELPHHRTEGARSPFVGGNSGFFTLPPGWEVAGNTTAGMANLQESLVSFNTGTQRQRMDLSYWLATSQRWSLDINFRQETREGSALTGAIFGFTGGNPRGALLPSPVDQTTRIIDGELEYSANRYLLGMAYHGSFFENHRSSVSWQNPFGQHPQWADGTGFPDGLGRLGRAPDNEFHQLRGYGVWHIGERSHLNVDLAVGRMQQDDAFLPFTVNQAIELDTPLPRASLDGKIDTTLVNLRFTTRPVNRLNLVFNVRHDDRDNGTAQDIYQLVGADSELQKSLQNARINLPYSYQKQEMRGDVTWRLSRRHRLTGGLQYAGEDRDNFAEAASLDEWTGRLGLRGSLSQQLSYRLQVEQSERRYDHYDGRAPYVAGHLPGTVDADDFENHPNLRKYNMTDRDRQQFHSRLNYQPLEVVSLGLAYRYSREDYNDDRFGLNEARIQSLSLDAGYYPNEYLSLTGFWSHDRYEASQRGRDWPGFAPQQAFDPNRDWFADHEDTVDTLSLTLQLTDIARQIEMLTEAGINRQLDLGLELLHMRTRGEIDVSTGPALSAEPFPDTVNRLNSARLWARYQFSGQWYGRFSVESNRFESRNFALDGVTVDTLANVLLPGHTSPDYSATWVTVTVGHHFQGRR